MAEVKDLALNMALVRGAMIPYQIRSFLGGMSDYEDRGGAGSFKFAQSLDIRKETDSLTAQQTLTDDLAPGTMTALAYATVTASDGNTYFFCYDGKILRRNSSGAYLLVYTDTNESGNITGAMEWYDNAGWTYLLWTTPTRLNIKKIIGPSYTNTEPWNDVNTASTGTWPKTNLSTTTFHTMKMVNGVALIANNNTLAMVGYDLSYSNNILQLIPGSQSKCLVERDIYAIVGCIRSDKREENSLFSWDGISQNWNAKELIPYAGINSMIDTEAALMQVGSQGTLYISDLNTPMPLKQIRGGGQSDPDGVTSYHGMALFGIYNNTNGANGIYSYGRLNKNATIVLNLEYPLTCDEISSVKTVGTDILIVYKSGTNYGVKKVDWNNKAQGIYQTLDLIAPLGTRRYPIPLGRMLNWKLVDLQCDPLPANTSIELWFRPDKLTTQRTLPNGYVTDANGWIQANMDPGNTSGGLQFKDTGMQNATFFIGVKSRVMEFMVKLNVNGNSTPTVNELNAYFTVG